MKYIYVTISRWGTLGRSQRRVIPACVVAAVQRAHPSPQGFYLGYKEVPLWTPVIPGNVLVKISLIVKATLFPLVEYYGKSYLVFGLRWGKANIKNPIFRLYWWALATGFLAKTQARSQDFAQGGGGRHLKGPLPERSKGPFPSVQRAPSRAFKGPLLTRQRALSV